MRQKLKSAREIKGYTQEQIAKLLHTSTRNYQRIEAGEVVGKVELWDKLEDLLEVNQRNLREK